MAFIIYFRWLSKKNKFQSFSKSRQSPALLLEKKGKNLSLLLINQLLLQVGFYPTPKSLSLKKLLLLVWKFKYLSHQRKFLPLQSLLFQPSWYDYEDAHISKASSYHSNPPTFKDSLPLKDFDQFGQVRCLYTSFSLNWCYFNYINTIL
jgi:hypothetical protein